MSIRQLHGRVQAGRRVQVQVQIEKAHQWDAINDTEGEQLLEAWRRAFVFDLNQSRVRELKAVNGSVATYTRLSPGSGDPRVRPATPDP